jgi:predicted N-acetyltransferase YhbS
MGDRLLAEDGSALTTEDGVFIVLDAPPVYAPAGFITVAHESALVPTAANSRVMVPTALSESAVTGSGG